MNRFAFVPLTLALVVSFTQGPTFGDDVEPPLAEPLKPFRPFLGKIWRGEFKDSTPEKPVVDVVSWERVLNGQAIRVMHSINDGVYGGETLILWDAKKKSVVYWYFTTAGFRTEGVMTHEDGQWIGRETVAGAAGGVTAVKSSTTILPDGGLHVKAEYLKDGKWDVGREVKYKLAPDAKVKFK